MAIRMRIVSGVGKHRIRLYAGCSSGRKSVPTLDGPRAEGQREEEQRLIAARMPPETCAFAIIFGLFTGLRIGQL